MSVLPNAAYAEAAMAISGRACVLAASGSSFGWYGRGLRYTPWPSGDVLQEGDSSSLSRIRALPTAVYMEVAMVASGRTAVLASSGNSFGQFPGAGRYALRIPLIVPRGATAQVYLLGV